MSSDGIATALKDSASSLVAANNSYEEAVALIASANRVVQDPGSVGAALRTISLRLRGTSTKELEEAGEDTTGVVESKSKLRTKIQGYTGVDILTDTGAYKSTYEILLEISKVWDDLTDTDRAGLLEMIAGKTRSNTAAAILSNGKDLEDALLAAQEAEGSALAENEKYLDSIQGKLDQFNNAVQTMWSNTLNDEWIKSIVEIGTFLVESIDNLGLIKTLLTVIGAGIIQKYFKGDLFGGLFGDKSSIESVKKGITDLEEAYARAQAKFNSSKSTEDRKAMEDAKANLDAFKEANKPILDAEEHKTALNEQLEKLKAEREQLHGDLQTAQDNFVDITTNGVQEDVREFVEIDTSHIDDQIAGVQEKLDVAKQQLADAKSATWDDYKALGSATPAKDRDNRVNDKKKEIKELEAELDNLQTKKDEFMSTKIDEVVTDGAKTQVTDLTNKIDETDKAILQTEIELKNVEVQANATGNAGLTAGQKFKTGFNRAKASIKQFGKEMLKSMAWSMAIAAVFEALGTVKTWISDAFKAADTSAEALQDKFEELDSELSAVESELRNLKSELEDTDGRIEELMSQGTLTFVEQEELSKLKSVSAELKAQIELQENLRKSMQQGVNSASIDATNAYLDTSFMSEKSRSERQEKGKETGEGVGQIVGTALGALGFFGGPLLGAALMAVGSTVGSTIGGWIGEGIVGAVYDSEQSVSEAMDNMLVERNNLLQKQKDALASGDTEAYNEATEALRTYDAQMAKHISQIQQNYNAMDWATASPEDRKEMMEYADWLDKYNISMGTAGAKSNAIARIFGDEAQGNIAKAKDEINKLKENLAKAKKSGEGVDEALAALEGFELNLSEDEVERLRSMGIYLYEVEDYFKEVVDTESEFIDSNLEDVAKDINKITDGLGALKSAFEEVIEEGVLTAKTITSLKDELKISTDYADNEKVTDAWREYLDVMMSGTATTEEMTVATEQLAQSIMEAALASENGLTPDNKFEYIAQLKVLGVDNAEEYVNDFLQKNMAKELEGAIAPSQEAIEDAYWTEVINNPAFKTGDKTFAALTEEEREDFLATYGDKYNLFELSDEERADIIERYDIEEAAIDGIIEKLGEKRKLEQQIVENKKEEELYNEWYDSYNQLLQDYGNFNSSDWYHQSHMFKDATYINKTTGQEISWQDYDKYVEKYNELQNLIQKGQSEGYLIGGKIIAPNFQAETDRLNAEINGIVTEIDTELTVDVQLKLELQNKSELVDDIQSTFDTLVNAQKEYDENGYVSVDTMQSLLKLEPKYLDLLVDENGELNLTKDNLYKVAQARLDELSIKQQTAIYSNALALATNGSKEALLQEISVMETATAVGEEWHEAQQKLIVDALSKRVLDGDITQKDADDFIAGIKNQIAAVQAVTESAKNNIENTLSTSGNTATAEANDAFQDAMDYWGNRIGAAESRFEQIQNEIDLLESQGKKAGAGYYQAQINQLQEFNDEGELVGGKLYLLQQQLTEAEAALAQVPEGSDEWWTIANEINGIHNEIDDVTMSIQDLKDAMADTHWYMFDEAHDRASNLASDLENIRNILSNEKLFDDEGNFTEAGLGTLASYVQDLGVFEGALANAKAEMDLFGDSYDPNKKYVDLQGNDLSIDSEQDWYDAAEKAEEKYDDWNNKVIETRYNIKDLYEQQIDAVEEYTQTLVENYNEYIDTVKEALDSERDLYEFKKSTEQKSKNIASIERRIASLSGSTNAADVAERRKLQAELTDAKSDMDDHYYSHAKEQQSQALDNEMTAYETAMNTYIEGLRTKLEESTTALYMSYEEMSTETKSFVDGVTQGVVLNAGNVKNVYLATGETIDDCLMTPWANAADAIGTFASSEGALGLMNSWTEAKAGKPFYDFETKVSGYLSKPWSSIIGTDGPVQTFKTSVTSVMSQIVSSVQANVSGISGVISGLQTEIDKIKDTTIRITTVYETQGTPSGGGGGDTSDKTPEPKMHADGQLFVGTAVPTLLKSLHKTVNGVTYVPIQGTDYYVKKDDAKVGWAPYGTKRYKYNAKGTTGTTRDEWAITDEPQFGDELVLVPGKDGNLSFMRKGTGVVPADLTQKLFELAQIPTSDLMNKNLTAIVPNITKNDFKNEFNFESLVHVDTVDSDTLPKLEKMVDKKIDDFSKALNYSLKRFAR